MDWNEFFMRHVYLAASKSRDERTKIGAILVKDGIVISEGFNGFPRGVKDLPQRYADRNTKLQFIVHAEHNAVLNAARSGISTKGSILYTNGTPCNNCSKAIIQAGVVKVMIHTEWQKHFLNNGDWKESIKISDIMFEECSIPVVSYSKKLGITGRCDGKDISI